MSSITLRWLYSDTEGSANVRFYEKASAFIIEQRDSLEDSGSDMPGSIQVVEHRVLRESLTQQPLDENTGTFEMTHTLVGFESRPYSFRVQASNTAGVGPMSAPSNLVTESCHAGQFLQTHRTRTQDITCASCPRGAYCAGLPHMNVTALQGFWRVPWAESGLVFQECPEPQSCFGVQLNEQGQAMIDRFNNDAHGSTNASLLANETTPPRDRLLMTGGAGRHMQELTELSEEDAQADLAARLARLSMKAEDFLPVAVPDLVLNAPSIEDCEDGHSGIMCTKCSQGFTRTGNFRCRRCASRSFILVVMVLVILLMIAIVAFVIRRTLMTKEREGRIEVMIMKIGVSHLQTVALAATFDL